MGEHVDKVVFVFFGESFDVDKVYWFLSNSFAKVGYFESSFSIEMSVD